MKKIFILILLCMIILTGCSGNNSEDIHIYSRTGLKSDSTNISIDKDYTLNGYIKEYNNNGEVIVTIKYIKLN